MIGRSRGTLLSVTLAGAILACSRSVEDPPHPAPSALDDVVISLERGPCYGTCPVYRVTIQGDGWVRYEGRAHVEVVGVDSATIAQEQVRMLVTEFERVGYASLPARFAYGEPSCPSYVTDAPSATTSISRAGVTTRVEHDYGCEGVPAGLTALERTIDSVAGSTRWTGR